MRVFILRKKISVSKSSLSSEDSQILDTFIDYLWLEEGLSNNTLASYRLDLSSFAIWLSTQSQSLLTVSQSDIQQYLAVRFPNSQPRSIGRLIASLRRFYRYQLLESCVTEDPTIQIQSLNYRAHCLIH